MTKGVRSREIARILWQAAKELSPISGAIRLRATGKPTAAPLGHSCFVIRI